MSYSQNSEMTRSKQHETKKFTALDMEFTYGLCVEVKPEWAMNTTEVEGANVVEWVRTGGAVTTSYVEFACIKDHVECYGGKSIFVYSTADGPIMAISLQDTSDSYVLLDPCIVQFDARSSRLNLLPIFNVARKLVLRKSAVRAEQAPAELLLAAYPGFLMNNRMAKYQLKVAVPVVSTPALTNEAS